MNWITELDRLDAIIASMASDLEQLRALRSMLELNGGGEAPDPVEALRASCDAQGIAVSWDGYVSEEGLGKLVGKSTVTVRNWRIYFLRPIPKFRKNGRDTEYGLRDIVEFQSEADECDKLPRIGRF